MILISGGKLLETGRSIDSFFFFKIQCVTFLKKFVSLLGSSFNQMIDSSFGRRVEVAAAKIFHEALQVLVLVNPLELGNRVGLIASDQFVSFFESVCNLERFLFVGIS